MLLHAENVQFPARYLKLELCRRKLVMFQRFDHILIFNSYYFVSGRKAMEGRRGGGGGAYYPPNPKSKRELMRERRVLSIIVTICVHLPRPSPEEELKSIVNLEA